MKTIYQLQQIANRLRQVTEANSISPEDTFGLQSDVLEYLADMEQNAEGLGIRKVYKSYSLMVADCSAPIGTNGKPLRFGQLVAIYNLSDPVQPENGNVYAWQKDAWLLMGKLGGIGDIAQNFPPTYYSEEEMLTFGSLGTRLGNKNNTQTYLSVFSRQYQLQDGQTAVYEFTCFNSQQQNGESWLACVGTTELTQTSEKLVVLRNDNWENVQWGNDGISSNFNWDTFLTDMHDSFVVMNFIYHNGAITIRANITTETGLTFYEQFTKQGLEGPVYVGLSVEKAHLYINSTTVKENE